MKHLIKNRRQRPDRCTCTTSSIEPCSYCQLELCEVCDNELDYCTCEEGEDD